MYFQMFLAFLGFVILWGYFYKYKQKPKYFYIASLVYVVGLMMYVLTAPHRVGRLSRWLESLLGM